MDDILQKLHPLVIHYKIIKVPDRSPPKDPFWYSELRNQETMNSSHTSSMWSAGFSLASYSLTPLGIRKWQTTSKPLANKTAGWFRQSPGVKNWPEGTCNRFQICYVEPAYIIVHHLDGNVQVEKSKEKQRGIQKRLKKYPNLHNSFYRVFHTSENTLFSTRIIL